MQSKYEVDISELIRARKEIKKWQKANVDAFTVVNQRMQKTGKATSLMFDNMGRAMNTTGKSTNRLGMQMQQAGYQVGDFAVQIQSGTNAMVALGQQGSQLLGIFGAKGAIAGAALAIGTALIMPLMRAKEEAKEAEDALKKLNETAMSIRAERLSLTTQFDERKMKAAEKHQATIDKITELELENAIYAEQYGKAKAGTIYANELLIKDLKEQLEVESEAYRIIVKRLDEEERKNKAAKEAKRIDEDAVKLAEQLKEQILLIKQEKFAALNFDKDTIGYLDQQKNIAYGIYERDLDRLGIQGKQKADLLAGYLHLLDQEQALERINRLNETRMAAEAFIAAHDPRFKDETALMGMPVKASKQSGPKKTKTSSGKKDALQSLMEQLTLEKELLGVNQDRAAVLRALGEDRGKYGPKAINDAIAMQAEIRKQNELLDKQQDLYDTIGGHLEDGMMSFIDHTKSAEEKFKEFAMAVVQDLYRILVVQNMVNAAKSAMSGGGNFFSSLFGGGKADGGPVKGGTTYLVGERGPELFTPPSNGNIVPNHELGGGTTIVQNINISTGVQQTVRTEIKQLMPAIADSAKKAVLDGKRRGGSYGKAFG